MTTKAGSLKNFFRTEITRWSILSFMLILLVSVPALIWILKTASESRIETMARTAAYSFRPRIVQGQARFVQPQIRTALKLKDQEIAVVRDPSLEVIYFDGTDYPKTQCRPDKIVCWVNHFSQVERLEPIYFDGDHGKVFGYLDLIADAVFDPRWVVFFLLLIPIIFISQGWGLVSVLDQASDKISSQLREWSSFIKNPKRKASPVSTSMFSEFEDLQSGIVSLNTQVERLARDVAKESKNEAQISILREIGHDLKTPLSQLAKYWALLIDTVRSRGVLNEGEVKDVERTMSAMGSIIRQVRSAYLKENPNEPIGVPSPKTELNIILADLRVALDVDENTLRYIGRDSKISPIQITHTEFYQVVENLVRNSLEALTDDGYVEVNLINDEERPTLIVSDRGVGISSEVRDQIFDFDYTTKAAKGTGIGLGIIKRICAEYDAELSYSSQLNVGTEFRVKFQPLKVKEGPYEAQNLSC